MRLETFALTRETVARLLPQLRAGNLATLVAVASIPEDIRGYGHVKARHLDAARSKEAALLAQFELPGAPTNAPVVRAIVRKEAA